MDSNDIINVKISEIIFQPWWNSVYRAMHPDVWNTIYQVWRANNKAAEKLYVTSVNRGTYPHIDDKAIDFSSKDISNIYSTYLSLVYSAYPGRVAIGIPPADIHLHVNPDPPRRALIELSKPKQNGHPDYAIYDKDKWHKRLSDIYGTPTVEFNPAPKPETSNLLLYAVIAAVAWYFFTRTESGKRLFASALRLLA